MIDENIPLISGSGLSKQADEYHDETNLHEKLLAAQKGLGELQNIVVNSTSSCRIGQSYRIRAEFYSISSTVTLFQQIPELELFTDTRKALLQKSLDAAIKWIDFALVNHDKLYFDWQYFRTIQTAFHRASGYLLWDILGYKHHQSDLSAGEFKDLLSKVTYYLSRRSNIWRRAKACGLDDAALVKAQIVPDIPIHRKLESKEIRGRFSVEGEEPLGCGSSGIVEVVRCLKTSQAFARKKLIVRHHHNPDVIREQLIREIKITHCLQHPHIIEIFGSYETRGGRLPSFCVLLQPVADYDLRDWLDETQKLNFEPKRLRHIPRWLSCLAETIAFLHREKVRHKDIKPGNILVKGDSLWLTDLGSAVSSTLIDNTWSEGTSRGHTRLYSAPEVIEESKRGRKADVFSLGCVFAEMLTIYSERTLTGFKEFRRSDDGEYFYHETIEKTYQWIEAGSKLFDIFHPFYDRSELILLMVPIVMKMMELDPVNRPSSFSIAQEVSLIVGDQACNHTYGHSNALKEALAGINGSNLEVMSSTSSDFDYLPEVELGVETCSYEEYEHWRTLLAPQEQKECYDRLTPRETINNWLLHSVGESALEQRRLQGHIEFDYNSIFENTVHGHKSAWLKYIKAWWGVDSAGHNFSKVKVVFHIFHDESSALITTLSEDVSSIASETTGTEYLFEDDHESMVWEKKRSQSLPEVFFTEAQFFQSVLATSEARSVE